jgi:hypothetical protein
MTHMKNTFSHLLNWRKNPGSAFYFAIPLFLLGMGLQLTYAIVMIKYGGDWTYLWILLALNGLVGAGFLYTKRKK